MVLVNVVNIALCFLVLVIGCWNFTKNKDKLSLGIGIAFGLFTISYIITIFGWAQSLESILITIRVVAYAIVAASLFIFGKN